MDFGVSCSTGVNVVDKVLSVLQDKIDAADEQRTLSEHLDMRTLTVADASEIISKRYSDAVCTILAGIITSK